MSNEIEIAKVFNPARPGYALKAFEKRGKKGIFLYHLQRNYFFFQGEKGFNTDENPLKAIIPRSYSVAAFNIAQLMESIGTSIKRESDCKEIKAHLGALDVLNPFIPLSLLCLTLSRNMSKKGLTLKAENIHLYRLLKVAQYSMNILITAPLTIVAALTYILWDLAKAALSIVLATVSACVTAPIHALRERHALIERNIKMPDPALKERLMGGLDM